MYCCDPFFIQYKCLCTLVITWDWKRHFPLLGRGRENPPKSNPWTPPQSTSGAEGHFGGFPSQRDLPSGCNCYNLPLCDREETYSLGITCFKTYVFFFLYIYHFCPSFVWRDSVHFLCSTASASLCWTPDMPTIHRLKFSCPFLGGLTSAAQ